MSYEGRKEVPNVRGENWHPNHDLMGRPSIEGHQDDIETIMKSYDTPEKLAKGLLNSGEPEIMAYQGNSAAQESVAMEISLSIFAGLKEREELELIVISEAEKVLAQSQTY